MPPVPPADLRCESLVTPLGVDTRLPRFSWRLESPVRGDIQSAWHVVVSSDRELCRNAVGDLWDSGLTPAERTRFVEYHGEPLLSATRYFWRARWRNGAGETSAWSDVAEFVTGFLGEGDWKPRWVSAREVREFRSGGAILLGEAGGEDLQCEAIYLRREFTVREAPVFAAAFISGLGCAELRLNGEKVGDRVLDPGWTDYRKVALYSTYDIASLLRVGPNAAGVILGNGRHIKNFGYGPPKATVRIEIEYESGEREVFLSDETWKTSGGPLRENGLYFGERYDARLEQPGWDSAGFNDSGWEKAVLVQGAPLASQMMPPIRAAQAFPARSITRIEPGRWVFDFGQNFSGWVRLSAEGPRGTEVRLRHAELLHDDGTLNMGPTENAEATDVYIFRGEGREVYEPRFTYHGFRYVELTGFPGEPAPETLEGRFVHSDVEPAGSFRCSDPLIGKIHAAVIAGQLSNLMSVPTDCPQRDERHGWLGDAHLSAEEAVFNFDMHRFYAKLLDDIRLAQKEDGSLPDVVPAYIPRLYPADPAWSAAYAAVLWTVHEHYEDFRLLGRHYPYLKKYVEFLGRNASSFIVKGLGKYGDWCPPGSIVPKKTPVEFTSTWYYLHDVRILARAARALGRDDDARAYEKLAADILAAFNAEFLGEDQYAAIRVSRIDTYPNQTSNALPLYLSMVPAEKKEKVLASLVRSVVLQQDGHVDTGILGTRYILDVLTENGQAEAAFRMATHKSYPGWGYMIEEGATTLWERWEKLTGKAMNSQNHIMLGSIDAWFYRVLAGLKPLEPGWKVIQVKPHVLGALTSAEASVRTMRGEAACSWQRSDGSLTVDVRVPVDSRARVFVPVLWPGALVLESDKVAWQEGQPSAPRPDITFSGLDGGFASFDVGSGRYRFEARKG